ncbi:ABC transporter permease [Candidatus Saccharibacteria bacterium]|nr:ABC transporter permease [Candidatus Saccharibacteria bacterium]
MKYLDLVKRAGRSLKSAKGRTILTSLAIAVGAFTLTASLAAGTGARQYANELIQSNVDPNSLFVAKDKTLFGEGGAPGSGGLKEYSEDTTQYGGSSFKALNQTDIEAMKKLKGVESVAPTYLVTAQYFTFEGTDKRYTADITAYDASVKAETVAGTLPELNTQLSDRDVVVPQAFIEQLGKKPSEMIGKTITLRVNKAIDQPTDSEIQTAFATGGSAAVESLVTPESKDETFTIRAISATSSTSFTASTALFISDMAARQVSEYITEGTTQYQKYVTATVRVNAGAKPDDVKAAVEKIGITARTAQDLQELLFTIVNVIQGIVTVFGVLALIASVFGIINTQYISVLERTREIGLMKALGMRGKHVSRLFQLEAAWIGLFGGVLGAVVAIILGTLLNPFITKTLNIGDSSILVFEPLPILALILALMLLGMVAGWFPARKAAKLDPIEALRTE